MQKEMVTFMLMRLLQPKRSVATAASSRHKWWFNKTSPFPFKRVEFNICYSSYICDI